MHETYKFSDEGFDFRRVFFDISKGLIECGVKVLYSNFKKKAFLVNYSLLLLKGFLKSRKQRVALNGQHYSWKDVNASIQGPILGAFCFLIYIYNMSYGLTFTPKPFTDVTSLFSVIHDVIFSQIDLTLSAAGGSTLCTPPLSVFRPLYFNQ